MTSLDYRFTPSLGLDPQALHLSLQLLKRERRRRRLHLQPRSYPQRSRSRPRMPSSERERLPLLILERLPELLPKFGGVLMPVCRHRVLDGRLKHFRFGASNPQRTVLLARDLPAVDVLALGLCRWCCHTKHPFLARRVGAGRARL
jgi:hypothetical protein